MGTSLTANVLGFLIVSLTLSGCASFSLPFFGEDDPMLEPVPTVTVITETAIPPKPIVPPVDQLGLREVSWVIITLDNIEKVFESFKQDDSKAYFAITAEGYEAISLNLGDIRALVQQQQAIIKIYENIWQEKQKDPIIEENVE